MASSCQGAASSARSTSIALMRPRGPLPATPARSSECALAMRLASGVATMRCVSPFCRSVVKGDGAAAVFASGGVLSVAGFAARCAMPGSR